MLGTKNQKIRICIRTGFGTFGKSVLPSIAAGKSNIMQQLIVLVSSEAYGVADKEVFVESLLALLDLFAENILSPDAELFPLTEETEHAYLQV